MDKFDIQKLRDLPIEGVAERLGLKVSRHKSLCPFHPDSHPSLTFNVSKNTFRCFVCGAHGGVIDLAMHLLPSTGRSGGVSFVDACQWLANENSIILTQWKPAEKEPPKKRQFDASKFVKFFEHPHLNEAATNFLFKERHLNPGVVRWCKLNSFTDKQGTSWLQIPYYDVDGNLIGVQSRNLNYSRPEQGELERVSRFRFPYGSTCHIYNLNILKLLKPSEPLFICEGASDCWAMLSSGHKAIAIPSATLLKPEDWKLLESLNMKLGTTFHMYPDADIPGENLYQQLLQLANQLGASLTRHSLPQGCKDFADYYALTL